MVFIKTEEVVSAYRNGASIRELSNMFAVKDATIRYHLGKGGIDIKAENLRRRTEISTGEGKNHAFPRGTAERAALCKEYLAGAEVGDLAIKYGKLKLTVRDMLRSDLGRNFGKLCGSEPIAASTASQALASIMDNIDKSEQPKDDKEPTVKSVTTESDGTNKDDLFNNLDNAPTLSIYPDEETTKLGVYRVAIPGSKPKLVVAKTEHEALTKVIGEIEVVRIADKDELDSLIK